MKKKFVVICDNAYATELIPELIAEAGKKIDADFIPILPYIGKHLKTEEKEKEIAWQKHYIDLMSDVEYDAGIIACNGETEVEDVNYTVEKIMASNVNADYSNFATKIININISSADSIVESFKPFFEE